MRPKLKKKAQVEVTFNWIYVIIAGAVILLFFAGLVVKQKLSAEETLAFDVVRITDSIINAGGVAEKTKNIVDISGLKDYVLYFDCQDKVGKLGVRERSASQENNIDPIFSPTEISGKKLILWSLPYRLPFKVTDLIIISSESTKYYLLGNDDDFVNELMNATNEFNREYVREADYNKINLGGNFQVRFIDTDGLKIKENEPVPDKLKKMDDDKVTAVSFNTQQSITYFQKEKDHWKKLNPNAINIISSGGKKDAAKYAAIFSANPESYECNMQKAFERMKYVAEVYALKAKEVSDYYVQHQSLEEGACYSLYKDGGDVLGAVASHRAQAQSCSSPLKICTGLIQSASALNLLNEELQDNNCLTIY